MTLTGFVLDEGFRTNVERAQKENLRTQIYALLATAELDDAEYLKLPMQNMEPRLNIAESTLHARVITTGNKIVWQSESMVNTQLPFPDKYKVGEFSFFDISNNDQSFTSVSFAAIWLTVEGEDTYIFQVAENKNVFDSQISLFRKSLWGWLAGVSIILIIVQMLILSWGLKPLRQIADDLLNIKKGTTKNLTGSYPKEITPLTQNINQLLESSQQQLTRYRDALGNMAHSLKTPIAVLQGIMDNANKEQKETAFEQIHTINNIIDYQLQRAATAGRMQLRSSILLRPVLDKIIHSLHKVHHDKTVNIQITIPDNLKIMVDQDDLYELLGNLLENAFKWCKTQIFISASSADNKSQIIIEDDGPGINDEEQERILLRGQRADQKTPGHGLGLAMVHDMLLLYEGSIKITRGNLSGAKIIIEL